MEYHDLDALPPERPAPGPPSHPYSYPQSYRPEVLRQKHSELGVASLCLGVLVGFIDVGAVVGAGVLGMQAQGGEPPQGPLMIIVLAILGGAFLNVLGFVMGAVALFQRNRQRAFAVVGVIVNGLILLGMAGLMVVGMMMA